MHDKFHVVNRIRSSVAEAFDLTNLRTVFFKAQDSYHELEIFMLEWYSIPSNYQELQRRMFKEKIQIECRVEDHHDEEVANMRFSNLRLLRDQTSFMWVLNKKDGKGLQTMPLNPDSASDIAKISPYMPCMVARKLSKPFLFRRNSVRSSFTILNFIVRNNDASGG